MIVQITHI